MQPGMLQQTSYPAAQQSSMLQQSSYPVAQQSVMPTATYPTSATTQLANTTAYQPVQQAFPAVQAVPVPTCGVPTPVCGVPMAQPVVIPQPVQQVQPVQPQIASTQATTAQHKKTTYVEAYLEPVDAQVPLMQPTVSKKVVEKKTYPVSDEIVYVEQKPLKNSTMQDYNLYLMENEYYSDDQPTYKKTVSPRTRADQTALTCENLPLATNADTMDWFSNEHFYEVFDEDAIFTEDDGSYAEVLDGNGQKWGLHASGDGDFVSHRIRFEALS